MSTWWTCPRQSDGETCRHRNPGRARNCQECGKPRPARKRPAHLQALDLPYEDYVALNGGDHCAVCGRERKPDERRLNRDHDHRTGQPRGLLCHLDNRLLASWVTPERLRAAADYLER